MPVRISALALALMLASGAMATTTVIGFDDVEDIYTWPPGNAYELSGYSFWFDRNTGDGWGIVDHDTYVDSYGNADNFPSQGQAAYNAYSQTVMVTRTATAERFDFLGAYFSGWGYYNTDVFWDCAQGVAIEGFRGGVSAGKVTVDLVDNGYTDWQWAGANLINIDTLTFTALQSDLVSPTAYTNWVMDNFTAEFPSVIPEPLTMLSALLSIGGLSWYARKRSHAA